MVLSGYRLWGIGFYSINLHNKPVNTIGGGYDLPRFNQMVKLVAVIPAHLSHYRAWFFSQCQCPMMRTRFRLCYQTKRTLKDKCIRTDLKHSSVFMTILFLNLEDWHWFYLPWQSQRLPWLIRFPQRIVLHCNSGGRLCLPPNGGSTKENSNKLGSQIVNSVFS